MVADTASAWCPLGSLASGAHPASTFPNSHLLALAATAGSPPGALAPARAAWSAPQAPSPLEELRAAVLAEDWELHYEEGRTKISMRPEWSASEERCSLLQVLACTSEARHVLEIGSFCGAGALAIAEVLPEGGAVRALELDAFAIEFGRPFVTKSPDGGRIRTTPGSAADTLKSLAEEVQTGIEGPFDMVVVDADKECARDYFDLVWASPGFLSEKAIVCVDMTAHKGQPPLRYVKYGFPHRWQTSSGQQHIDALRAFVHASPGFVAHELQNLVIVRRA